MIKHLFKLIWNKKKENFLLITEILISFMVMFAVLTLLVYYYQNYRQPIGLKYENIWMVDLGQSSQSMPKDSISIAHQNLKNALGTMSKIKGVSFNSSNGPFTNSMMSTMLKYRHNGVQTDIYTTDEDNADVLGIEILKGRWFNAQDRTALHQSVILNKDAAEKLTGTADAVGKILDLDEKKIKIIGVTANFKDKGDFKAATPGMFVQIDTGAVANINNVLLKVSPDADA
ncbi:MAG TPA: ABC transporter permease, partial [Pedobacter sp.]